jgi:hypothetical protein
MIHEVCGVIAMGLLLYELALEIYFFFFFLLFGHRFNNFIGGQRPINGWVTTRADNFNLTCKIRT